MLIIAFCLTALPARAVQCGANGIELKEPALCSRAFDFNGKCGTPKYDYPGWETVVMATAAWETSPIRIVLVSVEAIISSPQHPLQATIFAGNSYNADLMTPERSAISTRESAIVVHSEARFPSDNGMQFSTGEPLSKAHLDVHLYCLPIGAPYAGSMDIWYKLDELRPYIGSAN